MRASNFFVIAIGLVLPAAAFASFSDVPSSHPNYEAITYVQFQGIVNGYEDGTYRPDQTINRAEFTKIIMEASYDDRLDNYPEFAGCFGSDAIVPGAPMFAATRFFSDQIDEWAAEFVCAAKKANIINGYPDNTFRPATQITFAEAAKIISLSDKSYAQQLPNLVPPPKSGDPWYATYVRYLAALKVIPLSITRFDQPITRGEMAEMIFRLKTGISYNNQNRTYEELALSADSNVETKTYDDSKIDLHFSYPTDWGTVQKDQNYYSKDYSAIYEFSGLSAKQTLSMDLVAYDSGKNRYRSECDDCHEGDTTAKTDLIQQKSDLEAKANGNIGPYKASIQDVFSGEGGNVSRIYRFFTEKYRVTIYANYTIDDFWTDADYANSSTTSLFLKEIGAESGQPILDPINRLIKKRSDQPNLKKFYEDTDSFVQSLLFH